MLVELIHKKKLKKKTREQIVEELDLDASGIEILDNFDSHKESFRI